jgi:hypothetical protein
MATCSTSCSSTHAEGVGHPRAGLLGIRRRRHLSAGEFCETQRMAPTDDELWLVVDGQRWRRTDPADALDDSGRQDQEP